MRRVEKTRRIIPSRDYLLFRKRIFSENSYLASFNVTSHFWLAPYENRDSLTTRWLDGREKEALQSNRFPPSFSHGRAKLAWKVKLAGNPLCSNLIPALLRRRKRRGGSREEVEGPSGTLNFDFAQARSAESATRTFCGNRRVLRTRV